MKTRWTLLAAGLLCVGCAANRGTSTGEGGTPDQEKPAAGAQGGPSPEEMKAWMEAATPGDPHKKMEEQCGEWTTAGKMWMDPKGEPMTTTGTASIRMILGGRFQVQEAKGSWMGMPFEGFGISGYDNVTKEYVNIWMDNMGTCMVMSKGRKDEKGTLSCKGEMIDPLHPDAPPCKYRLVMPAPGKDSFKFEMHGTDSKHTEEFKCMELEYTRAK